MAEGNTSNDITRQSQVLTLKRNGNGYREPDPLDEALQARRKILGAKLMDQTVASTEADALKQENERLKAQIEHEQLQEQTSQAKAGSPWADFMMGQMQHLQGQLMDMNQRLADKDAELYKERFDMLQNELARLREQGGVQVDPMEDLGARVEQTLAIAERLRPPAPIAEKAPAADDPHLLAWMKRADHDHELRMEELRESREVRREELVLKRQEISEKDARERDRDAQMLKFYTDTAPKALELGQKVIEIWMQHTTVAVSAVVPSVEAAAAPVVAPAVAQPPPGAVIGQCSGCGATIVYMPDWPGVGCAACGRYYENTPDAPPADTQSEPSVQEVG